MRILSLRPKITLINNVKKIMQTPWFLLNYFETLFQHTAYCCACRFWHFDTNSRFLLDFSGVTIMFTVMMTLMWPHCVCFYLWGFRLDLARQWRCGCPLRERATIYATLQQLVQHMLQQNVLNIISKQYPSMSTVFIIVVQWQYLIVQWLWLLLVQCAVCGCHCCYHCYYC